MNTSDTKACCAVNLFAADLTVRRPTDAELARLRASAAWPDIQRHVRFLVRAKARPREAGE